MPTKSAKASTTPSKSARKVRSVHLTPLDPSETPRSTSRRGTSSKRYRKADLSPAVIFPDEGMQSASIDDILEWESSKKKSRAGTPSSTVQRTRGRLQRGDDALDDAHWKNADCMDMTLDRSVRKEIFAGEPLPSTDDIDFPYRAQATQLKPNFSQKPFQSLPRSPFATDMIQQCMSAADGATVRWTALGCTFAHSPQLPQNAALLAKMSPLVALANELRGFLECAHKVQSNCGKAVHGVVQRHLDAFTAAMAAIHVESVSMSALLRIFASHTPRLHFLVHVLRLTSGLSGGKLLSAITALHATTSEPKILLEITRAAVEPLFNMLESWVMYGRLEDAFGEFFIQREGTTSETLQWEGTYSIALEKLLPAVVPGVGAVFTTETVDCILRIGKTVDFLRLLGRSSETYEQAPTPQFEVAVDLRPFFAERAAHLGAQLRGVFLEEKFASTHIKVLTDYVLLQSGDFAATLSEALAASGSADLCGNMQDVLDAAIDSDAHPTALKSALEAIAVLPKTASKRTVQPIWTNSLPQMHFRPRGLAGIVLTPAIVEQLAPVHALVTQLRVTDRYLTTVGQSIRSQARSHAIVHLCAKSQKLIRAILHFVADGILTPHIDALHAALDDPALLSTHGCIEGMQWVLAAFCENVRADLFMDRGPTDVPAPIRKRLAVVNTVESSALAQRNLLHKVRTLLQAAADFPVQCDALFAAYASGRAQTASMRRCHDELSGSLQKLVTEVFSALQWPSVAELRSAQLLRSALTSTGFVRFR